MEFERYADDIVVHVSSREQAEKLLGRIRERLMAFGLELSDEKTKIVYCWKGIRPPSANSGCDRSFDFLGAQFGESGQRFGSIRPVPVGVFGVSRVQCNQVVGLFRNPPLLDAPLSAIRWQFWRSLSQMASAAPASPMTLPHFSMGT